jgi:lipopolysaccharide assembly protein A
MVRIITYMLLLVIAVMGISFSCLNAERVQVNYYINTTTIPLSLLLALTFIAGGFVALLFSLTVLVGSKRQQYHLKQQLRALQSKDAH